MMPPSSPAYDRSQTTWRIRPVLGEENGLSLQVSDGLLHEEDCMSLLPLTATRGWGERCRMAQATALILDSTYPEAFESENKFRLLRCCGQFMLWASFYLHDL
jgi:hypothetical protein